MFELSVIVTAYNQERYIAKALASVLVQNGPPLEIVVSDDHSTDGTWRVIQEVAGSYDGPHTVVAHQQPRNLGTVDNLRWAMDRSSGRWIMLADGDDLSLPDRARALMHAARASGASLVSSNAVLMDSDDNFVELLVAKESARSGFLTLDQLAQHGWVEQVLGAAFAFDRKVVADFGHLDSGTLWAGGDHVLPIRAALMGGVFFVHEPLMCWRRHDLQATADIGEREEDKRVVNLGFIEHNLIGLRQALRDLDHWVAEHDADARVARARGLLLQRMLTLTDAWTRMKAELYRDGILARYLPRSSPEPG